MGVRHLLAFWRQASTQFYHGTNQAAYEGIIRDGQFQRSDPESVCHEIEDRYGLPYDSVWMHKYNEFSRGRVSDPHVYFTSDKEIAWQYAEIGSEVVFDALNSAVHLLMWDELVDEDGNYRPGAAEKRKAWIAEETRKHYRPVVLTVDIPYAPYEEGTVLLPAPIPASWITDVEM